ncbi:MAG: MATE family efflux transporter [Paracoccaceae bacterium]
MTSRDRILHDSPGRTLWRLAVPNLAASLVQSLMIVTEGWYAGYLGPTELAGAALVFPLFMATMMLSAGAMGGAVAGAMARAAGSGDDALANAILRGAVLIAVVIGSLKGALVVLFGPTLFVAMGGADAGLNAATEYVETLFPFIALVWVSNMLTGALRGTGDMLRPAAITLLIVVSHLILIVAQILTGAPFGFAGAGLATLGAYAIGLISLIWIWTDQRRAVRLSFSGWTALMGVRRLLGNGLLAGSQTVMTISYSLIATAAFGNIGAGWLAGYGIGVRLELLIVPIIFGIGGAGMVATGTLLGAGRRQGAVRMGWLSAGSAAILVGSIGAVLSVWPTLWTGLFTSDAEIATAAAQYLKIVGPCYAFFGLGLCLYFLSQGMETLAVPVLGALLRLVAVVVGLWGLSISGHLNPKEALFLLGAAMVFYGLFIAAGLFLGPWTSRAATRA